MATCPECDAEVIVDDDDLEEMELGDPWDCEACGSRLRVSSLDPLEFDGDDDDDDDEEEEADGEVKEVGEEEESDDVDDLEEDDDADDDKDFDE
jgi:lysine biosynthesis protein LysW